MSAKDDVANTSGHRCSWPVTNTFVKCWQSDSFEDGLRQKQRRNDEFSDENFWFNDVFWGNGFGYGK
jgi:hypothetical protein